MTWTCQSCGGTELSRTIKQIELWAPPHPQPAVMQLVGAGEPLRACLTCRPTALSVVRDFRTPMKALARYAWKHAYLRYEDGTVSDRMARAEIEA